MSINNFNERINLPRLKPGCKNTDKLQRHLCSNPATPRQAPLQHSACSHLAFTVILQGRRHCHPPPSKTRQRAVKSVPAWTAGGDRRRGRVRPTAWLQQAHHLLPSTILEFPLKETLNLQKSTTQHLLSFSTI